ncbi:hypothetical protein T265_10203 [Opisthorchis viverrini]|uniref:Uncharacterized protein n=1 Tax=Opisthorchis viverrini TaxID=6198 RepID=A0A074Z7D4_OPIVI|nr:hypothetical protein T265_10203 [Opisthorchis viverrini]KER21492.1 hypothetical protein T265_10203 [Opisthorchis viverrini]
MQRCVSLATCAPLASLPEIFRISLRKKSLWLKELTLLKPDADISLVMSATLLENPEVIWELKKSATTIKDATVERIAEKLLN